jgi:hypothetical protein
MHRPALLLAAVVALAAPATAAAKPRPEWTDCKLTSVPKRFSMQKAFTQGIPVTFVCSRDVDAFVPARIDDRLVERSLSDDQEMQSVVDSDFMKGVKAGEPQRIRLRVSKGWPRRVMKRHASVRLLVDMAADRGDGMYSNSDFGKHVTLVR